MTKFDQLKIEQNGSDEWWMDRLTRALVKRYERIQFLEDWAKGEPPIPVTTNDENEGMKITRRMTRVNLIPTILANISEKLIAEGFRTAAAGDENGDSEAARIWRANNMQVVSKSIFRNMLTFGEAYAIVGVKERGNIKSAVISSEHPRDVITENHPVFAHQTVAALKLYRNDLLGKTFAVIYLLDEDEVPYMRVLSHTGDNQLPAYDAKEWSVTEEWEWEDPEVLDLSTIPVYRFCTVNGKGIFEEHIGSLQVINEDRFQRVYINTSQAAKQQILIRPEEPEAQNTGLTQYDIENGTSEPSPNVPDTEYQPKRQLRPEEDESLFGALRSGPGTRWELPYGSKYLESSSADTTAIDMALKTDIRILGEVTGTQFTLAQSEAINMSASGSNAIKARGVQIAREIRDLNNASLIATLASAFEQEGDLQRADVNQISVIWASIDDSSIKEKAEAAKAAKEAGVPWRMRMEHIMQMTPDQIKDAEQEQVNSLFNQLDAGTEVNNASANSSGTQASNAPVSTPVVPNSNSGSSAN